METALLRIRFTPLLKQALKNGSKYCLEIVPEVSRIENLDKISWKQEIDLIEYIIPVTYKIILKKQEAKKKTDDDVIQLDKTYHSCVDLLPPSLSTFDFGCGDVTRIISDTYIILGKITAKVYDSKPVINDNPINAIISHVTETQPNDCPIEQKQSHEQLTFVDNDKKDTIHDNAIPRPTLSDSVVDEITNTEKALTVCQVTETHYVEIITETSTKDKGDLKRKLLNFESLSLSPICSIDTSEKEFPETAEENPLNLVVDRVFQFDTRDISGIIAPSLVTRYEKYVNIKNLFDDSKAPRCTLYKAHKRELPEERVAKFIKKMEIEIMPLKTMLNEILQKCQTLGLSKSKHIPRSLVLYKTVPSFKNHVEKCKTERQTKSNRVVYSIVFDE